MTHNSSEYNFAYNEGGLAKFVWKNLFSNSQSCHNNSQHKIGSNGSYQGQTWPQNQQPNYQQQHQQHYGIGSSARNNQYQYQNMDWNQLQRGKG